jgi:hypothetical protein
VMQYLMDWTSFWAHAGTRSTVEKSRQKHSSLKINRETSFLFLREKPGCLQTRDEF